MSRGGITKTRTKPVIGKENILHVEVGSGEKMVEILHEDIDSDDSDIVYVGSSVGPPRTAAETKCTPKIEPQDTSPAKSVLPPRPVLSERSPVILFSALGPAIHHSTPQPSPISPQIDEEKPLAIDGECFILVFMLSIHNIMYLTLLI